MKIIKTDHNCVKNVFHTITRNIYELTFSVNAQKFRNFFNLRAKCVSLADVGVPTLKVWWTCKAELLTKFNIYNITFMFVLKKVGTLTNIHTNNTVKANNYTIVSNNYWIFTVSGRLYILFLVSFGDAVFTIWPKPAKFSVDKEYSGTNPVVDQVWISLRYCNRQFPKIEKWTFKNIWFSFEWNQLHLV